MILETIGGEVGSVGAQVGGGTSVGTGVSGQIAYGAGTTFEATDANLGAVSLLVDHPRHQGARGVHLRIYRDVG